MWKWLILCCVLVGFVLFRIALKKTLQRIDGLPLSKKAVLVGWQFLICALLSAAALPVFKATGLESPITQFNYLWAVVAVLGVFNAYGAYCQWCAIDISMSKTSIGTQIDDAIAILIGYFILNESNLFGWQLLSGIAMCFAAALILVGFKSRDLKNWLLVKYVMKYSLISGVTMASLRFFNLNDLPLSEFLVCWYGGSTVGSWLVLLSKRILAKKKIDLRPTPEDIKEVPVLSIFIWVAMLLHYSVAYYAPVAIYQPILLVSEAVLPTLVGLYYFHERKEMMAREWLAIGVGIIGTILVAMSSF